MSYPREIFDKVSIRSERKLQKLSRAQLQMVASALIYQKGDAKWSSHWKKQDSCSLRDPVERFATEHLRKYIKDRVSFPYKFRMNKFEEQHGKRGLAYIMGYNTHRNKKISSNILLTIEEDDNTRPSDRKFKIFFKLPSATDSDRQIKNYVKEYSKWDQMVKEIRDLKTEIEELTEAYGVQQRQLPEFNFEELQRTMEEYMSIHRQVSNEIEEQEEEYHVELRDQGLVLH